VQRLALRGKGRQGMSVTPLATSCLQQQPSRGPLTVLYHDHWALPTLWNGIRAGTYYGAIQRRQIVQQNVKFEKSFTKFHVHYKVT